MKRYISSAVKDIASESVYVRFQEAKNSSRGDVLARLAKDTDERVRNLVATNPNTPLDVLQELAHDPYAVVRRGITINPRAPTDLILKTANSLGNYSGVAEIYLDMSFSDNADINEMFGTIAPIVENFLKRRGYSIYSSTLDPDGAYYCQCGRFRSQADANEVAYELSHEIEDNSYAEIAVMYFSAEMLLE